MKKNKIFFISYSFLFGFILIINYCEKARMGAPIVADEPLRYFTMRLFFTDLTPPTLRVISPALSTAV